MGMSAVVQGRPLLERAAVLEAVGSTVEATRLGNYSALFVLAEPGLGKTSILAGARTAAATVSTGWAEGVAAETALPFGLLGQALGAFGVLREVDPVAGLGSAQGRASFYYRCARAIEELCTQQPRLVLVDDLHWTDPDSLGLLGFLLRRLRGKRFGLVATMRPWPPEAATLAQELQAAGHASIQRLAPLGDPAARQVAARAAGRKLSPEELENVVRSCRGNPLLLEQSAASVGTSTSIVQDAADPAGQLVVRFSGMPAWVLAVARAASVVGSRFSPRVVAGVAEVDDATVSRALGVLTRAGLVRDCPGGRVEFAHPLFAQALYDSTEVTERSRLHSLALRALLKLGAAPAEAAPHATAGQLVGDSVAIETLEAAGEAALKSGAFEGALRHLCAAVDLAGDLVTAKLLMALAEAQFVVGLREGVKRTCERLLDRFPDPAARADTFVMLARLAWSEAASLPGYDLNLVRLYTEAVAAAEGTEKLLDTLTQAVMVLSKEIGPKGVAEWSRRLRELGTRLLPDKRTELDLAWGTVAALAGEAAGTEVIRAALGPANLHSVMASASPSAFPLMLAAAFDSRLFVEQFSEADELFRVAWRTAEANGAIMRLGSLVVVQSAGCWWRGRFAAAHKLIDQMDEIGAAAGMPGFKEQWVICQAMMAVEEGDPTTALSGAAKAENQLNTGESPWFRTQLWRIHAELALDAGRASEAAALARKMRDLADRLGVIEPCWTPWADTAMIAFLRSGSFEEAQALVDHLDRVTESVPCLWPRSVASLGRAGLAEAAGDLDRADEHHRQAVEILEGIDLPLRRARALLSQGVFLRRTGRTVLARAPLARALEESEACGGVRLASQARGELQASGGRRRRSDRTQLSAQERNVVALAVEGATNDEIAASLFISAKTVEHHLSAAYAKLGIASRKDLRKYWPASPGSTGTKT